MTDQRRRAWGVLTLVSVITIGMALGVRTVVPDGTISEIDVDAGTEYGPDEYQYADTLYVEVRERVLELHQCYVQEMMTAPWRIKAEFWDLDEDIIAQTRANPFYWNATIRYDLAELATFTDERIRGTVIHEMAHVLTWELGLYAEATNFNIAGGLQEKLASRIEMWPAMVNACG